ncbi:cytoskeletal protein binding protein [Mycoemilia scoparia]|uniref:Actin cytoskeleton-regulatory complex protein SLA1 n=1 Tax=Mycoemilia scoparia TaxID=417184 RepID=A0A9W8DQ91_9FUNG|nr:cytoskeletal protein binding protein [Mycoemilia scoparia]
MPVSRVLRAIYDYAAQDDDEVSIKEGDIVYELDASDPNWVKIRTRPVSGNEEPAEGLAPGNYLEELPPIEKAKALYDYHPQESDETQIEEGEAVDVLVDDDPDWILVKSSKGSGIVPKTYIEIVPENTKNTVQPKPAVAQPIPEPPKPQPQQAPIPPPIPQQQPAIPGGKEFYSVIEKNKKNLKSNIGIIGHEFVYSSGDDREPERKWPLCEISSCIAKKQVINIDIGGDSPHFFEFTCGSKAEAEDITDKINVARRNAPAIGVQKPTPQQQPIQAKPPTASKDRQVALVLYDFEAQEDDELTIVADSKVIIVDQESSPEWWRVKDANGGPNAKEGLVPSSYLEIIQDSGPAPVNDGVPPPPPKDDIYQNNAKINYGGVAAAAAAASTAPKPRKLSAASIPKPNPVVRNKTDDSDNIPLNALVHDNQKPNPRNVRTWTDKSGAYKVEAEFLSLENNNQVHLYKTNGVKILVPLEKLEDADVAYIESITGKKLQPKPPVKSLTARQRQEAEAKRHPGRKKVNYDWDWFDFLTLKADVNADYALKYATTFVAERLDNESIPDITVEQLRSLSVRDPDISLIMNAFRKYMGLQVEDGSAAPTSVQPSPSTHVKTSSITGVTALNSPLEASLRRQQQIRDDESLARMLQAEEERGKKKHSSSKSKPTALNKTPQAASDPFANFDAAFPKSEPARVASPARPHAQSKTAASGFDHAQFSSVRDKLAASTSRSSSRMSNHNVKPATNTFDDTWTAKNDLKPVINSNPKKPPTNYSSQPLMKPLIPTPHTSAAAATATSSTHSASHSITSIASVSHPPNRTQSPLNLPTKAPQSVAQLNNLSEIANAKAQELKTHEQRLLQQREYLEKQAMMLKQQQEQLMQVKQTQQVERQLRELREQKERLELEKQREDQRKEQEQLKRQQDQLLQQQKQLLQWQQKMLQNQSQLSAQSAISNISQPSYSTFASTSTSVAAPSKLPAPLVPTQPSVQQQRLQQLSNMTQQSISNQFGNMNLGAVRGSTNIPNQMSSMSLSNPSINAVSQAPQSMGAIGASGMGGVANNSINGAFADFNKFNSVGQTSQQTPHTSTMSYSTSTMSTDKYDLFKRVDPRAQGVFNSSTPQPGMVANTPSIGSVPMQPTGVFALSNPAIGSGMSNQHMGSSMPNTPSMNSFSRNNNSMMSTGQQSNFSSMNFPNPQPGIQTNMMPQPSIGIGSMGPVNMQGMSGSQFQQQQQQIGQMQGMQFPQQQQPQPQQQQQQFMQAGMMNQFPNAGTPGQLQNQQIQMPQQQSIYQQQMNPGANFNSQPNMYGQTRW